MFTRGGGRSLAAVLFVSGLLLGATACSSDGSDGTAASTTAEVGNGADGGSFSLLSYNVAGLPVEVSKEHPDVNLPLISPLLADYDVVLTQEDFDWWKPGGLASTIDFVNYHGRLRADAGHEYQSPQHPGLDAVELAPGRAPEIGDGLGYLSKFPIEGNERVPWTECFGGFDTSDGGAADCLAMKGFALTRLTLAEGVVVDLYDLHGEAGGSPKDQALQADDFAQLAAYVEEHSKGHAVILGGDTNLHTDPAGPDAHEDSGDGKDLEIWTTFLEATGLTDSCTATDCDGPGRIDKVAYRSGGGVELTATSHEFQAERFVDAAGDDLSDHEPLEVEFTWSRIEG